MTPVEAFTRPATLTTERLVLRPLLASDADSLYEVKSDPLVTSCYGQEPHRSIEETRAWVRKRLPSSDELDSVFWAIVPKGEERAAGECCLWNFDPSFRCAELGYELAPSHWRRGLMTEAVSAVLSYGFRTIGLHRIEATPLARNEGSRALLGKLGFKLEGTLRQRHYFQGGFEDQLLMGLLGHEWAERGHPGQR